MYHTHSSNAHSARIIPTLIATSFVATVPATAAYAQPVSAAAAAVALPWIPFCAGCAAGAVVGGLTVGLIGKHSRRKLQEELDEVAALAERAEMSARRAEDLLRKKTVRPATGNSVQRNPVSTLQSTGPLNRAAMDEAAKARSIARMNEPNPLDASRMHQKESFSTTTIAGRHTPAASPQPKPTQAHTSNGGMRSRLQDRLGTGNLKEMPVISRGQERERGEEPIVVRPQRRTFNPAGRAAIIDKRIPRFDESLFPDTQSEQQPVLDDFEIAMKAMEDTLSAQQAHTLREDEQPTNEFTSPLERPDISDTESYIEYLVQDEMERNKNGSARRYSRAHLTMFEGTGDLAAARKALQQTKPPTHRPRHMQPAKREAQVL